ncbi:putative transcriptional regulatory protein [Lasiodiplodia hormozganensis]|uniref:Transcriptional regulatory protein n=1 Tax=Lasiodiplodia hormozganensis TaxID=869390 RepID=A0AA39YDN0_9PEZI|nr:putative transcriptional regulatory protein [Lasiodiplodia hormozganensis]
MSPPATQDQLTPSSARATNPADQHPPAPARDSVQPPPDTSLKRKRGRHGCLNCRRKRKKCDEVHPTCTKCQKHGETCEWDTGVIFRHNGLSSEHPSMREIGRHSQQRHTDFTIIDVTSSVMRSCREDDASPDDFQDTPSITPLGSEPRETWPWRPNEDPAAVQSTRAFSTASSEQARSLSDAQSPLQHHNIPVSTPKFQAPAVPNGSDSQNRIPSYSSRGATENTQVEASDRGRQPHTSGNGVMGKGQQRTDGVLTPHPHLNRTSSSSTFSTVRSRLPTPTSAPPGSTHRYSLDHEAPALTLSAGELAALDFLTSQPTQHAPHELGMADHEGPWISQDMNAEISSAFSNDPVLADSPSYGLYYPSHAYKDLQQNLHSHIIETARNSGLTRHGTPEFGMGGSHDGISGHDPDTVDRATARLESMTHPQPTKTLKEQREIELWQNYFNEVAPWLDKFDNQRHFQFSIPVMAKTCPHLRYSALALSARQQERKDPSRPYTESLGLYQEAIQNLVPELETMSTEVIASSVLLCVLEMIIVSPKDWGRHLDGCAILLQAANITGVSGGVNQALFWCFARMDVWGGYLSDSCTKVPLDRWLSSHVPMSTAVNLFKNECKGFDAYANYAVFLSASVVNVINGRGDTVSNPEARAEYVARWKALWDLVEDWYNSRPIEMQPLLSYPASFDDYDFPFPKILYGNPPATNGNQLYHFCAIRLLQEKPKEVRLSKKSAKSLIWHARQICGIAASNSHHGAWINGLQPLWVAGKLMSHPSEHRAILNVLARIENESGWATKWRADELKEYWGADA